MLDFESVFEGRRVLVTGHTGFKGVWLSSWLNELGADVYGIALEPDTTPALFTSVGLEERVSHEILDIRDYELLLSRVSDIQPEIVFHLAAQPLVRRSYSQPIVTFGTNALGTAHVLNCCRLVSTVRAVVCVTTDKVYENREWDWPYRENDRLGGKDPYSASKAAAELIAQSYQHLLRTENSEVRVATARGGNVIGGGDWSEDRLIPDIVRAIAAGRDLLIRNPQAVRPWQHVLCLCHGYLMLAGSLINAGERYEGPWNFSPSLEATVPVEKVLEIFGEKWQLPNVVIQSDETMPEAGLLALDSSKATKRLAWKSPWNLRQCIEATADWYRRFYAAPESAQALVDEQIALYRSQLVRGLQKPTYD